MARLVVARPGRRPGHRRPRRRGGRPRPGGKGLLLIRGLGGARVSRRWLTWGRAGCRNPGSSIPWPGQFAGHGPAPPGGETVVASPGAQRGTRVALGDGEQAVADLAVGGQPAPVTGAAERPGDRPDHADVRGASVDLEPLGGCGSPVPRILVGQPPFRPCGAAGTAGGEPSDSAVRLLRECSCRDWRPAGCSSCGSWRHSSRWSPPASVSGRSYRSGWSGLWSCREVSGSGFPALP